MTVEKNTVEQYSISFRIESPISNVIETASKIYLDESIKIELKKYLLFNKKNDIKHIIGPEDFDVLLNLYDKVQRNKDRVSEIYLNYLSLKKDFEAFYSIVYNFLWLKPELLELKNDNQRSAVVSQTIPEIIKKQKEIEIVIEMAAHVLKSLNNTFNILKEQSVAVQQKMYWRNLTMPEENKTMRY